jgi:hypothetical protein
MEMENAKGKFDEIVKSQKYPLSLLLNILSNFTQNPE